MITREAVRLWKNSNAFLQNIDMQYDDSFAKTGAKIGTSLRIRLPNDYTVRSGPAASVQDTSEQSTTLALATQKGVDVSFNSLERTMSLDDYSKRVLAPGINNLAGAVAADIMNGVEGGICNLTDNVDTNGNLLTPNATTYLQGQAVLNANSTPMADRKVVNDPFTESRVVASLSGLFNPAPAISKQYETGMMKSALGLDWMMDQTVLQHTTGTFSVGTVNGAGQSGTTLVTNAITGTLIAGDIITIANVYAVNRITKTSTGQLRQFVVTATVANGATSIPIYPAIVAPSVAGSQIQYQTVTVAPANGAALTLVLGPSVTYRKNFIYAREAVTMATADLELPRGVHEADRQAFDGVSMRMVTAYNVSTDEFITRLDILYGYLWVRPEWACIIPDVQ
jgi:hypothetical protein